MFLVLIQKYTSEEETETVELKLLSRALKTKKMFWLLAEYRPLHKQPAT